MDKKKVLYISLLFIITVIVSITYFSYAFFTSKEEYHGKINVVAGTLDYKIESNDLTNNTITLNSKETKIIEIEITSLNEIVSKYELYYQTNNNEIEVGYASDTVDNPSGEIGIKASKKVTVVIKNKTTSSATVTFGVQGGLVHNQIALDTGRLGLNGVLNICTYNPGDVVKEAGYTGEVDPFEVPCDGNYKVELWGAQGGSGPTAAKIGGKGAYTAGTISLLEDTNLYLYVGGEGPHEATVTNIGGYNGGGYSGNNVVNSYGGGGATDIRYFESEPAESDLAWNSFDGLKSRIMVAAGGGGNVNHTSYTTTAGGGGGLIGISSAGNYGATAPTGGTQTGAGTAYSNNHKGSFGYAPQSNVAGWGGGGGSGYWSGSMGYGHSGSGGSSFISGHEGCIAIDTSSTASSVKVKTGCSTITDDNRFLCSIHYSTLYFNDTSMIDGSGYEWTTEKKTYKLMPNPTGGNYESGSGNTGNGYARITFLGNEEYTITFNTDGGNSIESITVLQGNSIRNLPTPTREHDYFQGWYLEDTFETMVDDTYIPTSDVTLYAKFVPCTAYAVGDVVKTAGYTGSYNTFTPLCNGYYKVELWGATGKSSAYGGYTSGTIELSENDNLYLYVGQAANTSGNTTIFNNGTGDNGGYNGGGSTDVRYFKTTPTATELTWNNATGLNSRIMVAGAGGSASTGTAGAGGGLSGYAGGGTAAGTQTSFGGRQSTSYANSTFGRANGGCTGGNGYYPGGGATCANGAGGGSSYISGHTGCVAIAEGSTTATRAIKTTGCTSGTLDNSCSIHYSGKSFTDTKMIDGKGYSWTNVKGSLEQMPNPNGGYFTSGTGNNGNGYVRITYIGG